MDSYSWTLQTWVSLVNGVWVICFQIIPMVDPRPRLLFHAFGKALGRGAITYIGCSLILDDDSLILVYNMLNTGFDHKENLVFSEKVIRLSWYVLECRDYPYYYYYSIVLLSTGLVTEWFQLRTNGPCWHIVFQEGRLVVSEKLASLAGWFLFIQSLP